MRDRARPAALFSLVGIASHTAVRMGLHRDVEILGLCVLRSEERRRTWWQLQYIDITVAGLVGSLSLTSFAGWDTKLPANLEDEDLSMDMQVLPDARKGLTGMSFCLWSYHILYMQRRMREPNKRNHDLMWLLSSDVSLADKDNQISTLQNELATMFLQHCELLNPFHVYIQIGIRQLILAARRTARQPALVNAKISEMSRSERDDFLDICIKGLEYFIVSQTTESLVRFRWHNERYFQWPSCKCSIFCYHRFFLV
jgi:hypothetical protein